LKETLNCFLLKEIENIYYLAWILNYICNFRPNIVIMIRRGLEIIIEKWLSQKEIIILYGPRQTGKSTLLHLLLNDNPDALILNCERPDLAAIMETKDLSALKLVFGNKKIIAFDEAQKIKDIGALLKLIYDDTSFDQKIIATGSSSFELANKIVEPLTGRNVKFLLLPLSIEELVKEHDWLWFLENLNSIILYGSYPGLIYDTGEIKTKKLFELTSDYLFQDILTNENLRNSALLRKLLKALALQIGSQVSFHELSRLLGVSSQTIEKYLDLLEKSFIIFSLSSYSRNLRTEIKKSRKYYFYDLGIRNAILSNFTPMDSRTDSGAIWENFCVLERLKFNTIHQPFTNMYFWRTYDGAEIDLVEEADGKIKLFEFKLSEKGKARLPKSFTDNYSVLDKKIITRKNIQDLLH